MNFSTARSAIAEKNGGQLFSRDRKLTRKGRLMRFFICILLALCAVSQANGESLKQDDFFGEIVFTDDFSDESGLWEVGYWLDGSAWYQDGWLHMKDLTSYSGSTYVLYSESFADCIIEVETKLVAGTDDNWQGVACRWVDEDNYYDFSISADGYYELAVWVNGKRMDCTVDPTWSSHIRQGRDVINVMRAECIGNTLRLSANGHLLAEITDCTFASGKITLSVNSLAGTYSEIAFDNLVIIEPSPTRTPESTQLGTRKMVITDTQGIVAQISDYWIGRGGGYGNPDEYGGLALERGEATGEYDMCFRSVTRPCLVLPWDTIREVEIIGRYLPSGREFDVWARITLTNGEVLEREELAFGYIHGMTREGGQYSIDQASIQKISFECCTENQNVKGILCGAAVPTRTMVITDAQGGVIQVNKYTLGTPYGDGVWAKCSGLTIWWGEGQMKFLWDTLREISVTRVEPVRRGQNVHVKIVLMNGSVLEKVKLLDKKIVGETLEGASYTTSWADVARVSFRE